MYSLSEDDARQAAASKNQVVLGSLFGWRAFSLREGKITSPVRHESWRTRQRKAKCATSNPCIIVDEKGRTRLAAPGPGCGCGLYLYNTAQSLRFNESQYFTGACASTFATDLRAFVSGWGRAIQHQYGFRCQWLRIEAVLLPSYDLSSQVDLDKVSRRYPGLLFGSYEDWEKWPSYDYPASLRIIPKSEVPEDSLASFTLPKSRPDSQAATHQNWGTRQGTAWIQYGVYSQPGQYVGKTVAQLRQEFSALWMIPANAVAYLGQAKLSENYVVKFGDHIQFHRRV
ncbi:MAG TPA: hypothetical protein VJ742_12705 [Nitrososphaera sp.]|nr:hypothetical protein [Nitrososphaera sp.]